MFLPILLLAAPATLPAQTVTFNGIPDSALHVVVGDSAKVQLYVSGATGGVRDYNITLFVDTARVQLVRADSVPFQPLGAPTMTAAGPDRWTLSYTAPATGTPATALYLADLWFRMKPSATQGSYVSLKVNSLDNQADSSLVAGHRTYVMEVCQANRYWGDLSGEKVVNSRDALAALTAAVGRPVGGGFDLSYGDVDEDGMVTSRDALAMLSYSVRLYTGTRVGTPKTNSCAPLQPVAEDLFFFRDGALNRILVGDTVMSPFVVPIAPETSNPVSWSPDGQRVLYSAYTSFPYYYDIVASRSPFTTVDTLTRDSGSDYAGAWSPDGTRIAFISTRSSPTAVWVMNADGTSQTQLTFAPLNVQSSYGLAWSPDSRRIAFVAYSVCCQYRIWTVHADSLTTVGVLSDSTQSPTEITYNAAGDSILYYRGSTGEVFQVAATGGAGTRVSSLAGLSYEPGASSAGPAFRWYFSQGGHYDLILRRDADGRHLRHRRNFNGVQLAFRRPAGIYVNSVTVTPQTQDLSIGAAGPPSATAEVRNSDNSVNADVPVTWFSRDSAVAYPTATAARTANLVRVSGTAGATTWIVVTARGWRSDSVQVTVIP